MSFFFNQCPLGKASQTNGNEIPYFTLILIQRLQPLPQSFQRLKLPWMFVFSPSSDQDKYCQSGFCWLLLGSYSVAKKKNGPFSQRDRGNRAMCKAIRAVQLTDAVDIRLHFLSRRMPFISSTWATWLVEMAFFVQMSEVTFWDIQLKWNVLSQSVQ